MVVYVLFHEIDVLVVCRKQDVLTQVSSFYAPLAIVELARFLHKLDKRVNLRIHEILQTSINDFLHAAVDESAEPRVCPHAVYPILCLSISDIGHELVARVALTVIVGVRNVIVPQRSPIKQRVATVLIEVCREVAVDVSAYLRGKEPVGKRNGIDPAAVALLGIVEVAA